MPKTNSESDFGGSLTSDEEDIDAGPSSPIVSPSRQRPHSIVTQLFNGKREQPSSPRNAQGSSSRAANNSHSPRSVENGRHARSSTQFSNHDRYDDQAKHTRLRGADLFRATAHKIMRMHKTSTLWNNLTSGKAGAEPGIDPRHNSAHFAYGHIQESCYISVIDYNSVRSNFQSFKNRSFIHFLDERGTQKEPWAKARWIHIAGISWDVISRLALAYDLHPLSVEDVLQDQRKLARSKADYFQKHLFIRVLCHEIGKWDTSEDYERNNISDAPRSSSPLPLSLSRPGLFHMGKLSSNSNSTFLRRKSTKRKSSFHEELEEGAEPPPYDELETRTNTAEEAMRAIQQLKEGLRVNVVRRNLYMFLFRDGTLITVHQTNTPTFATPIMDRLRSTSTVLRSNSDASILLESILDLVVDQAMEVVEEYHKMLLELESDILLKPKVGSVRHLHIISGDLALHKRTLEPLKSLIYGLRRYDYDRCLALETSSTNDSGESETVPKVVGYMSHKSKIYLADVHDHMEYILSSLDMFGGIAENLINYTFNMASYEMNEVMRRLTLATIIFLPLTLLTGYFGMNFNVMPSVQQHSDILFWEIALPVMAVVVPLFMWSDLVRAKHYVDKKWDIRYRRTHRT